MNSSGTIWFTVDVVRLEGLVLCSCVQRARVIQKRTQSPVLCVMNDVWCYETVFPPRDLRTCRQKILLHSVRIIIVHLIMALQKSRGDSDKEKLPGKWHERIVIDNVRLGKI